MRFEIIINWTSWFKFQLASSNGVVCSEGAHTHNIQPAGQPIQIMCSSEKEKGHICVYFICESCNHGHKRNPSLLTSRVFVTFGEFMTYDLYPEVNDWM